MALKAKATKAKATGTSKSSKAAGKASKAKATDSTPKIKKLLEAGTFVKFNGYAGEVSANEAIFEQGQILYITDIDEDEDGVLYDAIAASDLAAFKDDADSVRGGQVSPAEVSEIKGTALERVQEQYTPIAVVGRLGDLLEENDNSAVAVAKELVQNINESYFYLGGAIAKLLQTGEYLVENGGEYEGEDAFNEFCQDTFGFKASKGRTLARVYVTFSRLEGFDPALLDEIGWSKAAMAERFVTDDNYKEVLGIAAETPQRELPFVLKEQFENEKGTTPSGRAASRGPQIVKKTMRFTLTEDSAETVELVLKQCMKQSGIEDEALALEKICVEWAAENVEASTAQKRIESKARKAAKAREAKEASAPIAAAPASASSGTAKRGRGRPRKAA